MKNIKKFIQRLYNNDGSFSYFPKTMISNLYSTCFGVIYLDLIDKSNLIINKKIEMSRWS